MNALVKLRRGVPSALLVASLVLAGCGGQARPGTPDGQGTDGSLPAGRVFVATTVTQGGAAKQLVPGTRVELRFFDEARLGLTAGCNSMSGVARLAGGRLVTADLATTEMGCDAELHEQDRWLADFLGGSPAWQLSGDALVLRGGDIVISFTDREKVDPDRPLVGTKWVVDTVVSGGVASSVPVGVQAYVTIGAGGEVTGSTGCNVFGGKATVTGDRLLVADLVATKRACEPGGEFEQAVLRVLEQPMTYRIEARRLTVTAPDGAGLQLVG